MLDAIAPPKFPMPTWNAIPTARLYWPVRLLPSLLKVSNSQRWECNWHASCNDASDCGVTSNDDQENTKVFDAVRDVRDVNAVPDEKQEQISKDEWRTNLEFIRKMRAGEKDDC